MPDTELQSMLLGLIVVAILTGAIVWIVKSRARASSSEERPAETKLEIALNGASGVFAILALGTALFGTVFEVSSPVREQLQALGMISLTLHVFGRLIFRLVFRRQDGLSSGESQ